MAINIRPGALLRRGTDGLTPAQLSELLNNPKKVKELVDGIEDKRKIFMATEATATAALKALEDAEARIAEANVDLKKREDDLMDAIAKNALEHTNAMAGAKRHAREIEVYAEKNAEQAIALTARHQALEDKARIGETEFAAREAALEAQEAAMEAREQAMLSDEKTMENQAAEILTIERLVKAAGDRLRQTIKASR